MEKRQTLQLNAASKASSGGFSRRGRRFRSAVFTRFYMGFILLLVPGFSFVRAQWVEDFEQADFPAWQGTRSYFIVEDGFLRSRGPESSASLVLTREFAPAGTGDMDFYQGVMLGDSVFCLEFGVSLGFVPSSTNQLRLYLFSRDSHPGDSTYAYYLQLGQTGSKNYWQLYCSAPDTTVLLWQGKHLYSKQGDMDFRFRVVYSPWKGGEDAGKNRNGNEDRGAVVAFPGKSFFRPGIFRFYRAGGLEADGVWEQDGDSVFANALEHVLERPSSRFHVGLMARYRTVSRANLYAFDYVRAGPLPMPEEQPGRDTIPSFGPVRGMIPDSGYLKINEILFNPGTGQSRFVEICNTSDSVLGLPGLYLAIPGEKGAWRYYELGRDSALLLYPGEYWAAAKDAQALPPRVSACRERVFTAKAFPSLDESVGCLRLVWIGERAGLGSGKGRSRHEAASEDSGKTELGVQGGSDGLDNRLCTYALREKEAEVRDTLVLDEVLYDEAWHHWLLPDVEGVSLERLDLEKAGTLAENWFSAAETSGYATPGCENSHVWNGREGVEEEDWFWFEPEVVTPDNDGRNDFTVLRWNPALSGFLCSITVYDERGRKMCSLCTEMLLGSRGNLRYDAVDDTGRILRPGLYVVFVELLKPDGKRMRLRYPLGVG